MTPGIPNVITGSQSIEEEVEEEEEELGRAETYEEYMPLKCRLMTAMSSVVFKLQYSSKYLLMLTHRNERMENEGNFPFI